MVSTKESLKVANTSRPPSGLNHMAELELRISSEKFLIGLSDLRIFLTIIRNINWNTFNRNDKNWIVECSLCFKQVYICS